MTYNAEEIARLEHELEQKKQWKISEGNVITVLTHWERQQYMADTMYVARETIRRYPDTVFSEYLLGGYIKANMVKLKQDSLPILMEIYGPKIMQLPHNEGVIYLGGHRNKERHGISLVTEHLFRSENQIPNERELLSDSKAKNFGLPKDIDEGFKCVPGRGRGKSAFGFLFNYRFGPGKRNYIELATNRTVAGRGSGMVNRALNSDAYSNEHAHQDDVDTFETLHQVEGDTSLNGKYWRDLVAEKNRRAEAEKRRKEEEERTKKTNDDTA